MCFGERKGIKKKCIKKINTYAPHTVFPHITFINKLTNAFFIDSIVELWLNNLWLQIIFSAHTVYLKWNQKLTQLERKANCMKIGGHGGNRFLIWCFIVCFFFQLFAVECAILCVDSIEVLVFLPNKWWRHIMLKKKLWSSRRPNDDITLTLVFTLHTHRQLCYASMSVANWIVIKSFSSQKSVAVSGFLFII